MGAAAGGGAFPLPLPIEAHPPTLMSATDTANTTIFFIGSPSVKQAHFQVRAIIILVQLRNTVPKNSSRRVALIDHLRCHRQFQLPKTHWPG